MSNIIHRTPEIRCPECNTTLNAASHPDDKVDGPTPGSYSICLHCGHLMVFGTDMRPRQPTDQEMLEIAGTPELKKIMAFRDAYQAWRKHQGANHE